MRLAKLTSKGIHPGFETQGRHSGESRIFLGGGGAPTPKLGLLCNFFAGNCMKMKEFGPPRGTRVPGAPLRSANETSSEVPKRDISHPTKRTDVLYFFLKNPIEIYEFPRS